MVAPCINQMVSSVTAVTFWGLGWRLKVLSPGGGVLSSVGVISRVEIGGLSRYLCIPVQGRGIGSSMGRRDFKLTSGESTLVQRSWFQPAYRRRDKPKHPRPPNTTSQGPDSVISLHVVGTRRCKNKLLQSRDWAERLVLRWKKTVLER